jgi:hypothetical protein
MFNDEIKKKKSTKKYIKKLEFTGLTRQTRDMCYEIEIITKKNPQ